MLLSTTTDFSEYLQGNVPNNHRAEETGGQEQHYDKDRGDCLLFPFEKGDQNYGCNDVELHVDGKVPGMTQALQEDRNRRDISGEIKGQFGEHTISWVA